MGELTNSTNNIWIVLHGYGQLAEFFIKKFSFFSERGDFVVAPEGLSSYYLEGSSGRVGASWMTKHNREDEIEDYVAYLDTLYFHLVNMSQAGGRLNIHVIGFSQGVATAARWICLGQAKVNKLIFWSGNLPVQGLNRSSNYQSAFFIYGLQDEYLHLMNKEEQVRVLSGCFDPYIVETFDGGHEIKTEQLRRFADQFGW